ncbi:DUF4302 domain-containing protein [Adhaeribacter pallidiroseus]|uniref:DUF4302 domain-containing protein n=1 Tax=Adhaeribacter pallidiroseus TaxID=2072847 RepID=A0A369QN46_9BACT|nr:DUF4302 domain-containing protein [Adhaeribacter pallidiroseus]RDC65752.1 hypothetical protein AHMF7616_04382 [Adhaeribacter pallidiroseus]
MKKIYLLSLLLLLLFTACQQDNNDPAPGQRPEERLSQALTDYKTQLVSAPYGWKATLKPNGGGLYSFFFKFNENDRVAMSADISSGAAGPPAETTYRLKGMQVPALIFDTYSPLHILADPDPQALLKTVGLPGEPGQGLFSDFEFTIDSLATNVVQLTGNLQQSKMILVPATQEEFNAYTAGQLKVVIDQTTAYQKANPFIYLLSGDGTRVQVNINAATKTFSLISLANGNVQILNSLFTYTTRGILLEPALVVNGTAIQELFWDSANQVFYAEINGSRVEVQSSPTPIIPLHNFVGVTFNTIAVPPQALPGWSPDFTSKQQQAASAILAGPYALRLDYMYFLFDVQSRTMALNIIVYQGNNGFLALYPFSYTKTADGVYNFTAQTPNGNAQVIAEDMSPLLNHINNDNFTMDFFQDPDAGTLGQMKSVQNPEFYFTGEFQTN